MSTTKSGKNNPRYNANVTIETREKLSISNSGKTISEEHKEKISIKNTGRKHIEESKEKMRKPKNKIK